MDRAVTGQYSAIVIGTGQAGPSLAAKLAGAGQKVAIIERAKFGGTCVNTGCIPTKTLVASARAAYIARRAADFGVMIDGSISVDMKRVKARKDQVSGASRTGLEHRLKNTPNCTVYEGHARFLSDREVQVGDAVLTAERIYINTGGRATVPAISGLDQVPYLTNSSMMDVDFLPPHLVIIGGSYIGLEFAQMYRRFGSKVTIVERGARLIAREDPAVCDAIRTILENEQIEVRLNADCIAVAKTAEGVEVRVNCGSGDNTVHGSHLLLAVGRQPNTDDLGLENTGIRRNRRGYIEVDDQLQTSVPGVWAMGDCNGRGAFTHTSYNDFEIVAANLLDHDPRRVSDRITAYALYIDPPLGRAGMTESEILSSGRPALVGARPMTRVGRANEKGETQGFMRVTVDAETKMILGAAILGVEGDEAIHCILDVMYAKAPYTVLQRAMHIHPTVSELIPTVLGELKPLEKTT
ncbi:FAD-containing oxidoreductase [Paludibaculum fermentans]|uniref:FAD-containing oxidoreductase n=1 Tax=Paludibaculum fermentans TaxID=1473598 RepID=A0A7S7NW78_PALFE|nr:FAD-containing oxidoreductase [Paludibaculum fermentans]QOY90904.1 FAD-containing oxidoreductase [Paludibaculum fermentans]